MASEATIKAVPGNMHIDARVIEVACIKSEVKFVLGCFGLNGLRGHLNDRLKQPTMDTTMIEAVKHYMISYFLMRLVAAGLKGHCPLVLICIHLGSFWAKKTSLSLIKHTERINGP